MSFIHDIIKIRYIREGYLPNIPPHLISDEEMIDAFMHNETNFFSDNYPLVCNSSVTRNAYLDLKNAIEQDLFLYQKSTSADKKLSDWVYSYMLGEVLGVNSEESDLHDLLVGLGCDNLYDVFTSEAQLACYRISKDWISKIPGRVRPARPPSLFGEPHVIKAIRIRDLGPVIP